MRARDLVKPPRPLYGTWSPEPEVDGDVAAPSDATLAVLKRRGYLTELSPEDEVASFSRISQSLHVLNTRPSHIFMPTYNCNLRCGYCFQDHMRTNPAFKRLLGTMSTDVVDRVFAAMPSMEEGLGLPPSPVWRESIGLFGGEPLLAQSRVIVEYILRKAKAETEGKATLWAITNGTELDAYADILRPEVFSSLQITLDGPPEQHDKRRIYADGSGSFDRIARNLTLALEQGVGISVRMNVDRTNIEMLPQLADEIVARGWNTFPRFVASTAPIMAYGEGVDASTTMSSWELDRSLDRLREQHDSMRIIGRPDDPLQTRIQSLFRSHGQPQLNSTFCSAHGGMFLFDSFGDVYACWDKTGDSNIRIGNVTEDGRYESDRVNQKLWRDRNVTTNPVCRKCRYALYCGGGCAALAVSYRGEMYTNFCDGFAARFRSSVAEAYVKHSSGEAVGAAAGTGCDR